MRDDPYPSLVGTSNDLRGFEFGLMALAVQRIEPMLAFSGLPKAIVESPGQLHELARAAVIACRAIRSEGRHGEVSRVDANRMTTDFFEGVAVAYGSRAAKDLGDWLRCLHIDRTQRNRLSSWVAVLQLATAMQAGALVLDPAVRLVLVDSAERAFGPNANADLE
jgi:hypothetical protein